MTPLSDADNILKNEVLNQLFKVGSAEYAKAEKADEDYLSLAREYIPALLNNAHIPDHWTLQAYQEALHNSSSEIQAVLRLLLNNLCCSLMLNPDFFVFGLYCKVVHESTDALGELSEITGLNRYLSARLKVPASQIQTHYVPLIESIEKSPIPAVLLAVSAVSEFDGKPKKRIFTKKGVSPFLLETNALIMVAIRTANQDISELLQYHDQISLSGSVLAEYPVIKDKVVSTGCAEIFPQTVMAPFDAVEQWVYRDGLILAENQFEAILKEKQLPREAPLAIHLYLSQLDDDTVPGQVALPGEQLRHIGLYCAAGQQGDSIALSLEKAQLIYTGVDPKIVNFCMYSVLDGLAKTSLNIMSVEATSFLGDDPEQLMSFSDN